MKKYLALLMFLGLIGAAHANAQEAVSIANEGTTGTTVGKLAKVTGAPSTAIITATTDTDGIIGIVVAQDATATTGNAKIAVLGVANCTFDGSGVTAGHFVINSSATAGDCADGGSTRPTTNQVLGKALATVASGTAAVNLQIGYTNAGGSGSPGGSSNAVQYNNGGSFGGLAIVNSAVVVTSAGGVPSESTTLPSGLSIGGPTMTGTWAGTPTLSGNLTFSGVPIFTGLSSGTIASGKNLGLDSSNNLVVATVSGGSGCAPAGSNHNVLTDNGSGACTSNSDATLTTGILSLGTNTSELGGVKMFGNTSGNVTIEPLAVAGTNLVATLPANTGTLAELNLNQAWTAGQAVTPDTATSCGTISTGGTATPDFSKSNSCQLTFGTGASATMTIANPTNVKIGQDYLITIAQNTSGSGTVSYGNVFDFGTAGAPTLTTTASKIDHISCYAYAASGANSMHCIIAGQGF